MVPMHYQAPYVESQGIKAFHILVFSGFCIFMQGNLNTEKINDKNLC
jgi:hypothetical protein